MGERISIKKAIDWKMVIRTVLCIAFSLAVGLVLAFLGCKRSLLEDNKAFMSIMVTLFGLSLTSAVFIAQSVDLIIKDDEEKAEKSLELKRALSKTLALMGILLVLSLILDVAYSIFVKEEIFDMAESADSAESLNVVEIILNTLIYSIDIYLIILQVDIVECFVRILAYSKSTKS